MSTGSVAGNPRTLWLCGSAVALMIVSTRAPVGQQALLRRVINVDELEVTASALDRFLGVPSTTLVKPGGPLQILAVPAFLVDFVLRHPSKLSAAGFLDYLSFSYRTPWHSIGLVRWLVIAGSSIGFALLFVAVARRFESVAAGLAAVAILTTIPELWVYSHMAVADGLGLGFLSASLFVMMRTDRRAVHFGWAGLLIGLAVASKLSVLVAVPFVYAMGAERRRFELRHVLVFLACFIAAFLAGCPYVWTDPLRFAKGVFGNAAKPGEALGWVGAIGILFRVLPPWIVAGGLVGLIVAVRRRRGWVVMGALICFGLPLFAASRAAVFFPRYMLPMTFPALLLAVEAVVSSRLTVSERPTYLSKLRTWALVIIGLVIPGIQVSQYCVRDNQRDDSDDAAARLIADIRALDSRTRLIVPGELFPYVADRASAESLSQMVEKARTAAYHTAAVETFAQSRGLMGEVVRAVPSAFNEREQAAIARLTIMARTAPEDGWEVRLWVPAESAGRFGLLGPEEATKAFQSGDTDILVWESAQGAARGADSAMGSTYQLLVQPR